MTCSHTNQIHHDLQPQSDGCAECLATGGEWVALRMCLVCGHVGCCDSSDGKHATAHFHATQHPVMRAVQSARPFAWCYVDETYLDPELIALAEAGAAPVGG